MLFTVVEGDGIGAKALVVEGGETTGQGVPADAIALFDEVVRAGRNRLLEVDGAKVFAEWYGPPPRLVIYGAVDTAEALCRGAKLLGWTAIVADARAAFLTSERIPSADQLIGKWPEDAIGEVAPDHQTAIVVLTHDDKFDEPALIAALATEAFYIGALGSRRNQERRRERLLEAGVPEEQLARIVGPVRPRHRGRHAGGDGALDPRRDPRGPRPPLRRTAPRGKETDPRGDRVGGGPGSSQARASLRTPALPRHVPELERQERPQRELAERGSWGRSRRRGRPDLDAGVAQEPSQRGLRARFVPSTR